MARRLRIEPYDANAVDGDGDGIVQENTAWERPVGTRLIDEFGNEIRPGIMSTQRPARMRVVDRDGNDVPYTPSYETVRRREGPQPTALGQLGAPSLAESGALPLQSLEERGLPTIGDRSRDIDAIVNPQTVEPPDVAELPIPKPQMLPQLERATTPVDFDALSFGADDRVYIAETLIASQWGHQYLQERWERGTSGYFQWLAGVAEDLTFEEFKEALSSRASGEDIILRSASGQRVSIDDDKFDAIVKDLLSLSPGDQISGFFKAKVSIDIAETILDNDPTSPKVAEQIREALRFKSLTEDKRFHPLIQAQRAMPYLEMPFAGGLLPPTYHDDLILWAGGGPKPLWLDSPETDPLIRRYWALPPVFISKESPFGFLVSSESMPWLVPMASLPVIDSDPVEVIRAKNDFTKLLDDLSDQDIVSSRDLVIDITRSYGRESSSISNALAKNVLKAIAEELEGSEDPEEQVLYEAASDTSYLGSADAYLRTLRNLGAITDERLDRIEKQFGIIIPREDFTELPAPLFRITIDPSNVQIRAIKDLPASYQDSFFNTHIPEKTLAQYSSPSLVQRLRRLDELKRLWRVEGSDTELKRIYEEASLLRSQIHSEISEKALDRSVVASSAIAIWLSDGSGQGGTTVESLLFSGIGNSKFRGIFYGGMIPDNPSRIEALQDNPMLAAYSRIASTYLKQWSISANGNDPRSYLVQEDAAKLFGIPEGSFIPLDDFFASGGPETKESLKERITTLSREEGELVRLVINAQYMNTQKYFKSRNITTVNLGRGIQLPDDHPYVGALRGDPEVDDEDFFFEGGESSIETYLIGRPLQSWTSNRVITSLFSPSFSDTVGLVTFSQIPVHQILSTYFTGNGCLVEYEYVVIGYPSVGRSYIAQDLRDSGAMSENEAI